MNGVNKMQFRDWLYRAPGNRSKYGKRFADGTNSEQESDAMWDAAVMITDDDYPVQVPLGFALHLGYSSEFRLTDPQD